MLVRLHPIRDRSVIYQTIDSRAHSGFVPDPLGLFARPKSPFLGGAPMRDGKGMNVSRKFQLIPHITKGLTPCSSFPRKARILLKTNWIARGVRLTPLLSTLDLIHPASAGRLPTGVVGLRSKTSLTFLTAAACRPQRRGALPRSDNRSAP